MKTKEELIQDYIDGRLSDEDRVHFDQYRVHDPQFREDLAYQQELSGILTSRLSGEAQALKASLRQAEQDFRATEHKQQLKPGRIRRLLPLLAAACVLLAATLFFFPSRQPESLYELPHMRSEIVRGEVTTEDQRYENAVQAFNAGQYANSSELLHSLVSEHPEILQYQYYLGLSLMGEEKFGQAATQLAPLADGESVFRDEAMYYLAIAYYHSGDSQEALRRANSVPEGSDKYPEARRLLKAIGQRSDH